jgi:predicted DNA-binding transcriptional regulator AlpA
VLYDNRIIEELKMQELIGIDELARLLKISRSALYKHASGIRHCELIHDLPAPALRGKRVLWVSQDIDDWLLAKRTFRSSAPSGPEPQPAPRRGRGRPRKYAAPSGQEGGAQ